ncbi:MAG: hypothetical protein ACHQAX_09065 [Gammaproteobacteria bacterium]
MINDQQIDKIQEDKKIDYCLTQVKYRQANVQICLEALRALRVTIGNRIREEVLKEPINNQKLHILWLALDTWTSTILEMQATAVALSKDREILEQGSLSNLNTIIVHSYNPFPESNISQLGENDKCEIPRESSGKFGVIARPSRA